MWHFFRHKEFNNFLFFMLTRSCHAKAMKWKLTFLGMCFKILAIERDDRLSVWLYRASVPMLFRQMTTYFGDLVFHSSLSLSLIIQVSLVCLWSNRIFFSHYHCFSLHSFICSFTGGAISNMYSIMAARYKYFPEVKTKGMAAVPKLVLFTSEHVSSILC